MTGVNTNEICMNISYRNLPKKCLLKLHRIILPINRSLPCWWNIVIPRETLDLREGTWLNGTIPFSSIPVALSSSRISRAGLAPWVLLWLSLLLCICKTRIKPYVAPDSSQKATEPFPKPEPGDLSDLLQPEQRVEVRLADTPLGTAHPLLVVPVTHFQSSQDPFFTYAEQSWIHLRLPTVL